MGQTDGKGAQCSIDEDRADRLDVGKVIAADLRQVEEPDVSSGQTVRGYAF
jgi:hypothetical protein